MDRRSFLTGLLGLAGAAALASVVKPESVQAGIINPGEIGSGSGILDELETSEPDVVDVSHRRGHWPRHHRPHRHHRRRVWRRVCRRVRHHGRWHRRCWRERVWI
ncbi:twin-arginine translocation signal domain-containing protein [Shinella zoogloeoides]